MMRGPDGTQEKPDVYFKYRSSRSQDSIRSSGSMKSMSALDRERPRYQERRRANSPKRPKLRLTPDLHQRVQDLLEELQHLQGQTGPQLELCMQTASSVLTHLCAADDLEGSSGHQTSPGDQYLHDGAQMFSPATSLCRDTEWRPQQSGSDKDEVVVQTPGVPFTATSEGESRHPPERLGSTLVEWGERPNHARRSVSEIEESLLQVWTKDMGKLKSYQIRERKDGEEFTTSDNRCFLRPESGIRLGWDFCSMILILLLSVLIPLEVCFFWDTDPPLFMVAVQVIVDIFFLADIVLNFFTAWHETHGPSGRLVNDFPGIAKHYAKGWLWIDIGASVPWQQIIELFGFSEEQSDNSGSEAMGMFKVLRYAKVARMMKVLRVLKLGGLMQVVEERMVAAQSMTVAFQLLKMTVVMLVISHNVACGWYAIAMFTEESQAPGEQTWLQAKGLDSASGASGWKQYVASFYFAITTGTTVGYGDIHPVNTLERAITIFVLVLSVGYIGQFLARVSQMVSSLRSLESQMVQAKREALIFMKKRKVNKDLQIRILRYIEHVYETDAITSLDDKIMGMLSESLKNQLALAVTGNFLKKFHFFETADENFLTAICQVCTTQRCGVGDIVVAEEQVAHEMYWVVHGQAAVLRRGVQIGSLKKEDWFSELSLFFPGTMRKFTVRCDTNCEFLALHHDELQKKVETFPHMRQKYNEAVSQLRRGNPTPLKALCPHCGSSAHLAVDCPKQDL